MKKTIQYAKNPKFVNLEKNAIDLIVKFDEFEEELPFTATPYDEMSYGVDLYNRALSGEFGQIEEFDNSKYQEILKAKVRLQRNQLLFSTDWTQMPDVPESIKNKYILYRQKLRDIPQQESFPENVIWPELES